MEKNCLHFFFSNTRYWQFGNLAIFLIEIEIFAFNVLNPFFFLFFEKIKAVLDLDLSVHVLIAGP